ncbi:aldehyde dehydrogenase family protein [Actinomadura rugatobispora]|uniref:Aldehyde dehydrogenase family protein n=1 Tax=Actinomadura rugatobispora TaxID=1994 RepID=A0ABW1A7Y0_9ACTN|nr:aldehyde dehydrogenase family protein [Actinomadura rugatobispora]
MTGGPVQTINGASAPGGGSFAVVDPATGEPFTRVPECTPAQVEEVMAAAEAAFRTGWRTSRERRRRALHAAADVLAAHEDELAALVVREQGKPLADARMEAMAGALVFRYYADLEVPPEIIQDDGSARVAVTHRPLGPVVAITAWNIPLIMACCKVAPVLAAGNTVVVKPSPFTPVTTLRLGELLREAFPPGVLNVVSGGGPELGALLTRHPLTRKITMTGSVATGKKVAAAAAPDLKRVTLELGGNDAAIVLDDADPAAIAERLFWGAFGNCGQLCIAAKRIYVHEDLLDGVTEALVARAERTVVGDGAAEGTELGPLQNAPQLARVTGLVEEARAKGARVLTGGRRLDRPGYFYAPTVLGGAGHGMRIVDEEQFGPVMPILAYRDLDEAVRLANDTAFGLGGSVWSGDPARAAEVAARIDAGMVWINTHGDNAFPRQPFGGVKWSGLGSELGPWGFLAATDTQVVYESRATGEPPSLIQTQEA